MAKNTNLNEENLEITTVGETQEIIDIIAENPTNSADYYAADYFADTYAQNTLTEFEQNVKNMVTCCGRNANHVASLLKIPVETVNEILSK